jgi:hypothetical protein
MISVVAITPEQKQKRQQLLTEKNRIIDHFKKMNDDTDRKWGEEKRKFKKWLITFDPNSQTLTHRPESNAANLDSVSAPPGPLLRLQEEEMKMNGDEEKLKQDSKADIKQLNAEVESERTNARVKSGEEMKWKCCILIASILIVVLGFLYR